MMVRPLYHAKKCLSSKRGISENFSAFPLLRPEKQQKKKTAAADPTAIDIYAK